KKLGWIRWATRIGVCRKCAGKGHHIAECTVGEARPSEKRNAMDHIQEKNVDSGMDINSEYLCTIHERRDMYYHCELNKVQGTTTLADTAATRNYISHKISLPNGQNMEVLGQCEFELKLSEWSRMVVATVLELDADFDIVLGLSWHRQWKPLPEWDTWDMCVNICSTRCAENCA